MSISGLDVLALLSVMTFMHLRSLLMSTLTVRNIEPVIKDKLRLMAAAHGHSMEEEVRSILRNAMTQVARPSGLGSRIHARFAAMGDVVLQLPERSDLPRFASFEKGQSA